MRQISDADVLWNLPFDSIPREEMQEAPIRRVKGKKFRWEEGTRIVDYYSTESTHAWLNFFVDFRVIVDENYYAYVVTCFLIISLINNGKSKRKGVLKRFYISHLVPFVLLHQRKAVKVHY